MLISSNHSAQILMQEPGDDLILQLGLLEENDAEVDVAGCACSAILLATMPPA